VSGDEAWRAVKTVDGRSLEVVVVGDQRGVPLVFQGGTPFAAVPYPPVVEAAQARGLCFVTYSRPGYAMSAPMPGRSVADAAGDVAAILDSLEADGFVTLGWSGGGPHALACAALLRDRCLSAAILAGVAPYGVADLDWLAGQGEGNIEEFDAALRGDAELTAWLTDAAEDMSHVSADDVVAVLGDLMSDVDQKALTDIYAQWTAMSFRKALSGGIAGWRDDDLAFLKPWGFDLNAIPHPVAIWQGGQDRMVPYAHGEWLAEHVPVVHAHLLPDDGHLSIAVGRLEEILDELMQLAGLT
jgi:pimeloyl-ACP methyl ester carboxylesterase